jgi:hypothetical protein
MAKGLSMKTRKRHSPEQIVKKLRDADAMLAKREWVTPFGSVDRDLDRANSNEEKHLESELNSACTGACTDSDLAGVVAAWAELPDHVKTAIVSLCKPHAPESKS